MRGQRGHASWRNRRARGAKWARAFLTGVPSEGASGQVSVKESLAVAGCASTAGLAKRIGTRAVADAPVVAALRLAGAVPFCQTNLPQTNLSYGCSNPVFGETCSPLDPRRTPGGSSGGEAALLAAGGSLLGIGPPPAPLISISLVSSPILSPHLHCSPLPSCSRTSSASGFSPPAPAPAPPPRPPARARREAHAVRGGAASWAAGADVGGSVRVPAAFCGVCGFKPGSGRSSTRGSYSSTAGQSGVAAAAGPLCRSVAGLEAAMRATTGAPMHALDAQVPPLPWRGEDAAPLRGQRGGGPHALRVGFYLSDGFLSPSPACARAVRKSPRPPAPARASRCTLDAQCALGPNLCAACALLRERGHEVVQFEPPSAARGVLLFFRLLTADGGAAVLEACAQRIIDASPDASPDASLDASPSLPFSPLRVHAPLPASPLAGSPAVKGGAQG